MIHALPTLRRGTRRGCVAPNPPWRQIYSRRRATLPRGISKHCQEQCQNLMLPFPDAQGRELLLQDLLVLFHTILHHLRAMLHRTEVPANPLDECLATRPAISLGANDRGRPKRPPPV